MKREKLITFIIPVYNAEKYLEACLTSVINQTVDDYDVVLINDGSTDNSQAIIDEFCSRYPQKIQSFYQKNQGISAARNRGIEVAKGEYITFIDNDDLIEKNYVEKASEKIKFSKCDMVIFGYNTITENGKVISTLPVSLDKEWARWGVCTVWLIVAKKSLFIDNEIRFPVGLFNEDIPVSIQLSFHAKRVETLPEILYHYRVYTGNTSSKIHSKFEMAPESRTNVFKVFKEIIDHIEDENIIWMIQYNAIKFYYGMLLAYFQRETKETLIDEYNKFTKAIKMYFPNYKKVKVYFFRPKGEPLKKRIAVKLSMLFDRMGLFKLFLLLVNRKLL